MHVFGCFFQKTPNHYHIPNPPHCTSQYIIQLTTKLALEQSDRSTHWLCRISDGHYFIAGIEKGYKSSQRFIPKEQDSRNPMKDKFCQKQIKGLSSGVPRVVGVQGHHPDHHKLPKLSCCKGAVTALGGSWQQCPGFAIPSFSLLHLPAGTPSCFHHISLSQWGEQKRGYSSWRLFSTSTFSCQYKQKITVYF